MEKAWTSTTFHNDDEPALSAELLNAKDSAADEIDNRVVELGNKVPFSLGIDENGNCGYIKPGEDKVTPFGSGGSPVGAISPLQMANVMGLTSEMTTEILAIADHIVQTVSSGDNDASVSIDGVTYLYRNVTNSPVTIDDGTLQLSYDNTRWTLKALVPMTDENDNKYNQNDIIQTWMYNSAYTVLLYL